MVMVDQLSIPALQSAELVFRRLEVIRQAHKASPSAGQYKKAVYGMGADLAVRVAGATILA